MTTRNCALVLAAAVFGIAVAESQSSDELEPARVIRFGGIEWQIKDSGDRRVGPGLNWFSSRNVTLDADGRLHLRAAERDGACVSAEVVGAPNLGYGTYRFTIDSSLDTLAPNLVLGLFVWDDTAADPFHREIDVEAGHWGQDGGAEARFVIQPFTVPTNMVRFSLPRGASGAVYSFTWSPGRVSFRADSAGSSSGNANPIKAHVFERMIPEPGSEQPRVNLWCADSKAPAGGTGEVILRDFRFTPFR